MAMATLGMKFHINSDNNVITLDSGDLRYIDNITKEYKDEKDLLTNEGYASKIAVYSNNHNNIDGDIVLTYVKNNDEKYDLKLLYDDPDIIRTRTSSLEEIKSETEKSRKLLLNSKNQLFLTLFLLNKNLQKTTTSTVRMTIGEYKIAKAYGLNVTTQDGEYRISIRDVLRYRLENKKLGSMRLLVEDTLEVWKKNMLKLPDEDLYFYSRELRLLINEYNYRKIPRRAVYNLLLAPKYDMVLSNPINLAKEHDITISRTEEFPKKKVLIEDHKIA